MARIRSIKPEFPQSESMGRVSRDARLLFIELWTLCDDSGRTRAVSRMLASLLFPYDDDAVEHIDGWLEELEREKCIVRYQVEGTSYIQVCKWLIHQKIDKPSASKIPEFEEKYRIVAKPRERSSEDQGRDQGKEGKGKEHAPRATRLPPDWRPSAEEIRWAERERPDVDVVSEIENFRDFWHAKSGKDATKTDWSLTFKVWIRRSNAKQGKPRRGGQLPFGDVPDATDANYQHSVAI
jgi:DnaT-like ssDNA binding protein